LTLLFNTKYHILMLRIISIVFLTNLALLASALVVRPILVATDHVDKRTLDRFATKSGTADIGEEDQNHVDSWKRRSVMTCGMMVLTRPEAAFALDDPGTDQPNFDALLDLPPVTAGCVRLFLCRHGQTENNRLRKVQGARIDAPINENGVQQAANLGKALQRLNPKPTSFFSSNLLRAKMTAEIASSAVGRNAKVKQLDSLAEVDFGPVADGQAVSLAKAGMQATYAAWAIGSIDFRPQGGEGESGRDVSCI
jgi:Histidine phosphatase superfamily (branch 1)